MDKTKLIPALIISIAILVLLIITTVVTNINKGNKYIRRRIIPCGIGKPGCEES